MPSDEHGYCPHGVYVGGMGPDYMCGQCEIGDYEVDEDDGDEAERRHFASLDGPMLSVPNDNGEW